MDGDVWYPSPPRAYGRRIRKKARRRYAQLRRRPDAVNFEKRLETDEGDVYKADVDDGYRALALRVEPEVFRWFWVGDHDEYTRILNRPEG